MGHVHLNVRNVEAQKKFWLALGGTPIMVGPFTVMKFPGVLVFLNLPPPAEPPSGGNAGAVVSHVGFTVPNFEDSMAKWKAAGVAVGISQRPKQVMLLAPDDLRIEVLEDPAQTVPIAFHHVHFLVEADNVTGIKSWYVKMFGAKPGMRGMNEADDIPGANLTFSKSDTATARTKGRVIDHIGFEIYDLEEFCKKLEASGVKFDRPYRRSATTGLGVAFLTDPWGTYIELNEGMNRL